MIAQRPSGSGRVAWLLLFALVAPGCLNRPLEPVAPKWDVGLTVPVMNRLYTLSDLASSDTNLLHVDQNDVLTYSSRVEVRQTLVGDALSLSPFTLDGRVRLGPFGISPIPPLSIPIALPGFLPGQPLPPTTRLSLPPITVATDLYREITLRSGRLMLRLRNNLPVTLTVDSTITLRDSSGSVLAGFTFVPAVIAAGQEGMASLDCAGLVLPGALTVANLCISEPGASSTPSGDLLVATLEASDLSVSRAVLSSIPSQVLTEDTRFSAPVTDSNKVREAWIRSGSLDIQLVNPVPMNIRLQIRSEELLDGIGRPYSSSVIIPALGSVFHSVNLSGMRMRSLGGGFLSEIGMTGTVDLFEGSGGRPVTVDEDDEIGIHVTSTVLSLDSVVGVVRPTVISVSERVPVRLGDLGEWFSGEVRIPAANLTLFPSSTLGFPLLLDLVLIGQDAENAEVVLQVPPSKTSTAMEPIVFPAQDVGRWLSRLSGVLPDTIRVAGRVIVNPEYDTLAVGTLGRLSGFGGQMDLNIPLNLSFSGTILDTVVYGDTTGDGNRDYQENRELMQSMNSGRLHVMLENGLPVQGRLKITLLDHRGQPVLTFPRVEGDSLEVGAPTITGGEVQTPARNGRILDLSQDDIRALERVQLVRLSLSLATAGSGSVVLRGTASIRSRVWAELFYRVEP